MQNIRMRKSRKGKVFSSRKSILRKTVSTILILAMLCTGTVGAAIGTKKEAEAASTTSGEESKNIHEEQYLWNRYGKVINSYLVKKDDGNLMRVEYIQKETGNEGESSSYIIAETYDSSFTLLSTKKIDMEEKMSLFGGFYEGKDAFYMVFGQPNTAESSDVEVCRVVKYDKEFNRLASSGLYGANTYWPFDAGSLRMSEYGGMLYIRTCHTMYKYYDGIRHQSSMTMVVRESDCYITDCYCAISNYNYGYVSHSFNQFIDASTGYVYTLDHGDSHPRNIVLSKYKAEAGSEKITGTSDVKVRSMLDLAGMSGDNTTNATINAFEVTDTVFRTVGSSMDQSQVPLGQSDLSAADKTQNIFVSTLPRNVFEENIAPTLTFVTEYTAEDKVRVSPPQEVKVSDNTYMLLWEEEVETGGVYNYTGVVKYVLVDQTGKKLSEIQSVAGSLSDCKPVLQNDRVVWYSTNNSSPVFYSVAADGSAEEYPAVGERVTKDGVVYEITKSERNDCTAKIVGVTDVCQEREYQPISSIEYGSYVYQVNEIADNAFAGNKTIQFVTIPATITKVGDSAFVGMEQLNAITNDTEINIKLPIYSSSEERGIFMGWVDANEDNEEYDMEYYNYITSIGKGFASMVFSTQKNSVDYVVFDKMMDSDSAYLYDYVKKPADPVVEGYRFLGWTLEPEAEHIVFYDFEGTKFKNAITLYAVFESDGTTTGDSVLPTTKPGVTTNPTATNQPKATTSPTDTATTVKSLKKQKITVSKKASKRVVYAAKTLKKKRMSLKINAKAKGKIYYRVQKKYSHISVKKNGMVTIKKGCPKGTYKIIATASATKTYRTTRKTITIKVK